MSGVLHRSLRTSLRYAVGGDGCHLIDAQGNRYLDASGGAAVSSLGHSNRRVVEAIQRQVAQLPYAHTSFFTNQPVEELAQRLIDRAPAGFGAGRAAFVGSGSEAMEVALKLARQYFVERGEPARSHFIARRMSYHGNTLGALSVGGHFQRRAMYAPLLMPVSHIAPCHAYRFRAADETDEAYGLRCANELGEAIERVGPERVAAFVAEPVVGATLGSVTAPSGYFRRVREICDRHGVLFIADEVMCGTGRTGSMFAMEQEGACPDIITLGKGLGAGYLPIGAALAAERVLAPIEGNSGVLANGHTYMSHAVACAGALAVLKCVEDDDLLTNVRTQGARLDEALRKRFDAHPHVGDIRGRGLLQAIELVADRSTKQPFPARSGLAERIRSIALDHGLVCYPSSGSVDGESGEHVLLAPPYIITAELVDEIVDRLAATLDTALREVGFAHA
ncbi:MAG: aspartate aminotransferase family protein [Casimicrobiaceae bacterium]